MDNQTHLDGLSSNVLACAELVGDVTETAGGGQLHDTDGHLLLRSEEWTYADVLVHDEGGHQGSNESCLVHVEESGPLFVIPGLQVNPLPPVITGGTGPELVQNWSGGSAREPWNPWHPGFSHFHQPHESKWPSSGPLVGAGCGRLFHAGCPDVISGEQSHVLCQLFHPVKVGMHDVP